MIRVEHFSKRFSSGRGRSGKGIDAVRDLSFTAHDGEITGLLGANGAGKTTTLRAITALVEHDAGTIRVDDHDCARDPLGARAALGILTDARGLYTRLTARENIVYFGRLQGLATAVIEQRLAHLAHLLDMDALLERRTEGFSQGERMKVAIARAMVHDPRNLILDEPTNGLDVASTRALREVLRQLRSAGKCILLSSHVMQEISALCDRIVVMAHGRCVAQGTPDEILVQAGSNNLEDALVRLGNRADGVEIN